MATQYSHRRAKPAPDPATLRQFSVPPFTTRELLAAIPAHCSEISTLRSLRFVARDFAMCAGAYALLHSLSPHLHGGALLALRLAYVVFQSLVFTGIWTLAHEAGHRSMSKTRWINDAVGFVCHTGLLVPYFPWRIIHARHHAATGHATRDENFVPRSREEKGLKPLRPADGADAADSLSDAPAPSFGEWLAETMEDAPLANFVTIAIMELLGVPLYFWFNFGGQRHYPFGTNHFMPSSSFFTPAQRSQVLVSDAGLVVVIAALVAWTRATSVETVWWAYALPYLVCNFNIVLMTFLQHTDPALPHYSDKEWTWSRGALCTMDRSFFGWVGHFFTHSLCETHVVHHISSRIPHYHAREATEALRAFLGEHYQSSSENMLLALWKNNLHCKTVDPNDDVMFYRDANGHAKTVLAQEAHTPSSAWSSSPSSSASEGFSSPASSATSEVDECERPEALLQRKQQ